MSEQTNQHIELNVQNEVETPVSQMAKGYAEMDEFRNTSMTSVDEQHAEIERRIKTGNFEGIPSEMLISYGLKRLANEMEQRRTARNDFKSKQEERAKAQAEVFAIQFEDEQDDLVR